VQKIVISFLPSLGEEPVLNEVRELGMRAIPYDLGEFLVVANFLLRSASSPT
jgi:hypothetical protein